MARSVICISHATGAGGEELARTVADQLGYRVIDEEIVARVAERQNIAVEDLADVERRKSLLDRLLTELGRGDAALYGGYGVVVDHRFDLPDPQTLRGLIRRSIEETADEGDVVILSHAASFALGGRDDVLRVLVTASPSERARRVADEQGLDMKKAAKVISDNDAGRADYLKRFYGVGSESPAHYDLVVNTDTVPAARFAAVVAAAAAM